MKQLTQDDFDYLKQVQLFIGFPCYGNSCAMQTMVSFMELVDVLIYQYQIVITIVPLGNESLVTRARNRLTHKFLQSDFTHFMFIDSDIEFSPLDIARMLLTKKKIVGGAYSMKEIHWANVKKVIQMNPNIDPKELELAAAKLTVNYSPTAMNQAQRIDEPIEVMNCATGFLLIQRGVFETLIANDAIERTVCLYEKAEVYKFWVTGPDKDNIELSEDFHFCKIARDNGYEIFILPDVVLNHIGSYSFKASIPFWAEQEAKAAQAAPVATTP